ncbi:MAG: hypothetical protein LBV50_01875 [Novosphingobium sp.]|jgi:hypothetical protein|nr:hypothetical protein [Novosphingobium sp.]
MERFPILKKSDLDEAQRALWDELTLGPRGFYTGGPEADPQMLKDFFAGKAV